MSNHRRLRKKHGKPYQHHRNNTSIHKLTRNYVKSYLNQHKYEPEIMEEFIYPKKYAYTYTWWDATPGAPCVFRICY
ncbi:MAG: hypothetical protein ACR2M6_04480 [Vampirovibrionia bacterium]